MRFAHFVLPTIFGLGAAGIGGQLLWRASELAADDAGRAALLAKGGALTAIGVLMLGLLIWKVAVRLRR